MTAATPDPGGATPEDRAGSWRVGLALAGLAPLVLYWPLLLGRALLRRDLSQWVYPAFAFARQVNAAWNPLVDLGVSTAANPLHGRFYPLHALFAFGVSPVACNLLFLLHLVAGSIGFFFLLRRFGARPLASAIGGLSWAMGGFLTSMWTFGIFVPAAAYAPWCALGFMGIARVTGTWARLFAIGCAALPVGLALLLGEIFVALLFVGFGIGVAGVHVHSRRDPPRAWRGFFVSSAIATALGFALGAAALGPARQAASDTERAEALPLATAERGSFHPARLAEFGVPGLTQVAFNRDARATVDALGGTQPLALSVYAGASVLALALLAFERRRRTAWVLAVPGVLGLLLALGRFTPIHRLFRVVIPPFSLMRLPEKYLVLTVASLALLVGLGCERLLASPGRIWRRWLMLLAVLLAPLLLTGSPFSLGAGSGMVQTGIVFVALPAIVWLARTRTRLSSGLLAALVVADLGWAAGPILQWESPQELLQVPPVATAILDDARARGLVAPPRLYRQTAVSDTAAQLARDAGEGHWRAARTLRANIGGIFGIDVVPGYDAAISPYTNRILALGENDVLRILGADYALLAVERPNEPFAIPGLTAVMDPLLGARLFRVDHPLPRVYLAGAGERVSDADVLSRLLAPDVVSGARVLVAINSDGTLLPSDPSPAGTCRLVRYENTRVEAACEAQRPALAVFLERHALGWSAGVNGNAAPLLRANLAMRAVRVPAGKSTVVLTFDPPGQWAGLAISVVAAALIALLLLSRVVRPGIPSVMVPVLPAR